MVMSLWPAFLAHPVHTSYYAVCIASDRVCPSIHPIDRQQQQHVAGLLLRSGEGPQQISLDSCCCRATCGSRKFRSDCKEVLHTLLASVRVCPSIHPIDRQQQQHVAGLLLRSGEGPQQISLDSCCCRATCGSRKFWSDCKEVLHTCF